MPEKPRAKQSHRGTTSQYIEINQAEEGGKSIHNGAVYNTKKRRRRNRVYKLYVCSVQCNSWPLSQSGKLCATTKKAVTPNQDIISTRRMHRGVVSASHGPAALVHAAEKCTVKFTVHDTLAIQCNLFSGSNMTTKLRKESQKRAANSTQNRHAQSHMGKQKQIA